MTSFWRYLSRDEIGGIDKNNAIVLVPVAAIEQHGPHLPVGTDSIILEGVMDKFVKEKEFAGKDVLVAPLISIGKSNEHMDFPGTITLKSKTMYDEIYDICSCIVKHGFKKIMLVNSHGGNTDLLNLMSRDLRIDLSAEVFVFDWWFTPFWKEIMDKIQESDKTYGVYHACELETALMMAIAPSTVKADKRVDEIPTEIFKENKYYTPVGPFNIGWKTKDLTKSGVVGEPSYATPEKGKLFLQYAVDKLADIVLEAINFEF